MNERRYQSAIVVPCYNEEKRLPVEEFAAFAGNNPQVLFVFANDGSKDGTSELLKRLATRIPGQAVVLDNAVNRGKAEVVRDGMLWAIRNSSCAAVGFWDADLATPLGTILEMQEVLDEKTQILMVFGARVKLLGRHIERKAYRHYLGRVFATVVSNLLRLAVYDTQCGAKLFRNTAMLESLFAEPFVSRWIFDVEIIARFLQHPMRRAGSADEAIYELPLREWKDIDGSKVKPHDFFKALRDLWRIRQRYAL